VTPDLLLAQTRRTPSGCLEWAKGRFRSGYGAVPAGGRIRRVHRLLWELMHGPLDDGLHVLHRCDNPPCIEPSHLWVGTHADNMADRRAKGHYGSYRRAVA